MRLIARSAANGDGALEVRRYVGLLALLVIALALVGAPSATGATRTPMKHAPTLLWKTYPLVQHAAPVSYRSRELAAGVPGALPLETQSGENAMRSQTLLFLVGSLLAALAGLLMVRSALAELRKQTGSLEPRNRG